MRDGSLGVAWPSIRTAFGQPLAALGVILLAGLGGYLVASTASGRLARRLPPGVQLIAASTCAVAGLAAFAAGRWWPLLPAGAVLLGAANGIVDVIVNAHVALRHGAGSLNLVHAGWGIGSTAGPLVMTAGLAVSGSWRPAFALFAALEALLLTGFVVTRRGWSGAVASSPAASTLTGRPAPLAPTLILFFTYSGLEITAGQWAFAFLVGGHGIAPTPAGVAVAAYWGALTAGRLAAAGAGSRVEPRRILDGAIVVAASGFVLLAAWPAAALGIAGLVVAGFGLGPVFPTVVALTPRRVGTTRSHAVIGYQLAAATLGGSVLSAAAGLGLQRFGAATLGALCLGLAAVVVAARLAVRPAEAAVAVSASSSPS